jgi:hypothetical protein
MHSRNIKFSEVESGIFIEEAFHLQTIYHLDTRLTQTEPFSILWPGMGPMKNALVLFLMEAGVSRVLNNLPYQPSPLDDYINGTIQYLYWRYTDACLERSFVNPYRNYMLEALLLRLFNEHLDHCHKLNFEAASTDMNQWTLLADVGAILLEIEFPMGSKLEPLEELSNIATCINPGDFLCEKWNALQDSMH